MYPIFFGTYRRPTVGSHHHTIHLSELVDTLVPGNCSSNRLREVGSGNAR